MSAASLSLECRHARDTVNALIDFLAERRDIDQAHRELLRFDLDRAVSVISDLDRAAERRPAIGLLAPLSPASDVLVATLAGVPDARALGLLAGNAVRLPVMAGLVPSGDGDGVAAMVRLTHESPGQAAKAADAVGRMMGGAEAPRRSAEHGVRIDLLSLADVIKVLARAYFAYVSPTEAPQSIDAVLAAIEQIAAEEVASAGQTGLSVHHVAGLRLHLEQRFREHPRLQLLTAAGYWDAFAALAPRATAEGRRRLAGLLWAGLGDFDTVYGELAGALDKLNHATEIIVSADAVREPQAQGGWGAAHPFSILAASTLLSTADAAGEVIEARSRFGQPVPVARNILTALAREVTIAVEGDAAALLARVDVVQLPTSVPPVLPRRVASQRSAALLDGPGEAPWLARALAASKSLYLAECATADLDLTGLVVQLDAVRALSAQFSPLVTRWIEQTQGATPQVREANDTTLFVAVDAPVAASPLVPLKEFLGGAHKRSEWLERWGTESAFDNLFILGITQRRAGLALGAATNERLPQAALTTGTAVATLSTALTGLDAGSWQRHVRDAAVAVDEALHAGDGGVVYLAQSVSAIDYGRAKRRQVAARLQDICIRLSDSFERFLYASAPDAETDWRHRAALATQARLRATANDQRIGALLDALMPRERELAWLYQRLDAERSGGRGGEGLLRRLAALDHLDDTSAERIAAQYARRVMVHWLRRMRLTGLAPGGPLPFGFTDASFGHLIEEIALAASRTGVEARMTAAVQLVVLETRLAGAAQIARVAMVAGDTLSAFLSQLGYDSPWSSLHPRRRGTLGAPLFERQSATGPEDLATLQSGRVTLQFTADWCESFGLMTEDTIAAARGMRLEEGEFRELAELLALLSANTKANARERLL